MHPAPTYAAIVPGSGQPPRRPPVPEHPGSLDGRTVVPGHPNSSPMPQLVHTYSREPLAPQSPSGSFTLTPGSASAPAHRGAPLAYASPAGYHTLTPSTTSAAPLTPTLVPHPPTHEQIRNGRPALPTYVEQPSNNETYYNSTHQPQPTRRSLIVHPVPRGSSRPIVNLNFFGKLCLFAIAFFAYLVFKR